MTLRNIHLPEGKTIDDITEKSLFYFFDNFLDFKGGTWNLTVLPEVQEISVGWHYPSIKKFDFLSNTDDPQSAEVLLNTCRNRDFYQEHEDLEINVISLACKTVNDLHWNGVDWVHGDNVQCGFDYNDDDVDHYSNSCLFKKESVVQLPFNKDTIDFTGLDSYESHPVSHQSYGRWYTMNNSYYFTLNDIGDKWILFNDGYTSAWNDIDSANGSLVLNGYITDSDLIDRVGYSNQYILKSMFIDADSIVMYNEKNDGMPVIKIAQYESFNDPMGVI